MIKKYLSGFQKNKILKQKFCLDLFQENFLKRTTDKETQECNSSNESKLIRNFERNLHVKSDFSKSKNKYILHLLNSIFIKSFIQSYQIQLLDIRKINLPNSYKINFAISSDIDNNFHFINEFLELHKNIIIQRFKLQFFFNLKKYFIKNNILLSIYFVPCFDINKPIPELLTVNNKYIISVFEKDILTKYPLEKIKSLGFLSDNKNLTFGLIELPNKKVYKIMLGSYLGIEQALVIGIYPEKIILINTKSNKIIILLNKHGN